MKVECEKCGHKWDYKGKSAFHTTCPKCQLKTFFFIKENLKYAKPIKCGFCEKEFIRSRFQIKYCTLLCAQRASQPAANRASHEANDNKGPNKHNWKGGISKNHMHYRKFQVLRYPERTKCRQITLRAKKSGKIVPPSKCESCGREVKLHAHHEDYSKPLDVKWLCRPCHNKLHFES
jgi:hypothetical protein